MSTRAVDRTPAEHEADSSRQANGRHPVSPLVLILAVGCSISFWYLMHFRDQAEKATVTADEATKELEIARKKLEVVEPQARLGDLSQLTALRDKQYDFTVNSYGYDYLGNTADFVDSQVLMYGLWQKGLAFFLRDFLTKSENPDAVFLDIGSNVGHHSLFLASQCAAVHGIEPNEAAAKRFQAMIDHNAMQNVFVHGVGFSSEAGELPYYPPREGVMIGGTFQEKIGGARETTALPLPVVRGDDWVNEKMLTGISLIRISMDGYEEPILQGLQETLIAQRPVVVVEVTPAPLGTIESLEQFKSLFPENYDFISLTGNLSTTMVDGKYGSRPFGTELAKRFFAGDRKATYVGYPVEKKLQVP
jgi:FkbM family methyltransferase